MTRTRIALTLTTLGLAGLLGLTGCGAGPAPAAGSAPAGAAGAAAEDAADAAADTDTDTDDVADEVYALATVGLTTALEADPAPSTATDKADSADSPDKAGKRPRARKFLRKNTLHGEMTMQGRDGVKTVVVQRGTVTAVGATTVSAKSADGFTQSWTFGDKLRVAQDRKTVATTAIKEGVQIGIAGAKDGDKNVARLIVIK